MLSCGKQQERRPRRAHRFNCSTTTFNYYSNRGAKECQGAPRGAKGGVSPSVFGEALQAAAQGVRQLRKTRAQGCDLVRTERNGRHVGLGEEAVVVRVLGCKEEKRQGG